MPASTKTYQEHAKEHLGMKTPPPIVSPEAWDEGAQRGREAVKKSLR